MTENEIFYYHEGRLSELYKWAWHKDSVMYVGCGVRTYAETKREIEAQRKREVEEAKKAEASDGEADENGRWVFEEGMGYFRERCEDLEKENRSIRRRMEYYRDLLETE